MAAYGRSARPFGTALWVSMTECVRHMFYARSPTGRMLVRLANLVLYVVAALVFYAGVMLWLMVEAGVLE